MTASISSRDNVSCVRAFYVEEDAEVAERIVADLGRVNIRFYEEGGEGMAPGVYTTLLVFVSEAAAADPRLREEVETAYANGKGVVVVYLGGTFPASLGDLFDRAEDFVMRPDGEEALLRRLATAHDMRACRKETLEPYEGPLDYIFISYAHKNSVDVLPVVRDLQDAGFRIWYDAGIEVGSEWDAYIMDHLKGAKAFICFQSPEFRASTYCQQEIDCALENLPGAVVVACVNPNEKADDLPDRLRDLQGVLRCDSDTDRDFFEKLISAGELESCRDEYRLSEDGTTLVKYLGGSAVVRIPEGVKEIGPRAVVTPNARRVIVPDGVTKIAEQAFIGCGLLEEVDLPGTVVEIGKEAFLGCGSLREFAIPPEVEVVNESCFAGCVALERVTFAGEKVEDIMPHAFEDCTSLIDIEWPSSVKRLWRYAFANCSSLDLVIPASVEAIEGGAVYNGCKSLAIDPANETYFFKEKCLLSRDGTILYAVAPNDAQGDFSVPEGIVDISSRCAPSEAIGKIIPEDIRESRTLPMHFRKKKMEERGIELIGASFSAFSGCCGLVSVSFPISLLNIGDSAFANCTGLESASFSGKVKRISREAFKNCASLASIALPDGVEYIGDHAFENCASLTSITLPDGVGSVGTSAFEGCISLASVGFPNTLERLSDAVFKDCTSLASISLPESITFLGRDVFCGCTSLVNLKFPENLEHIGNWKTGGHAFRGCSSLVSVSLPANVKEVAKGTFESCSSLASIQLPDGLTVIEERVFQNCLSLKFVRMPSSLATIKELAFEGCASLVSVELPDSLETIEDRAFSGCSHLDVVIPKSVSSIGKDAFLGCQSLRVDPGNPAFAYSDERGLVSADGKVFYGLPIGFDDEIFCIPDGVETLNGLGLSENILARLKSVVLPKSLVDTSAASAWGADELVFEHPEFTCVGFRELQKRIDELHR